MNDGLNKFTQVLTSVLVEETECLDNFDYAAAIDLLPRKHEAVASLQAAVAAGVDAENMDEDQLDALREDARLLVQTTDENRLAIERALVLQTELIKTIAQALPKAAHPAPAYQLDGAKAREPLPEPYAFHSQM